MKWFPWSGFFYELRRAFRSIPLIVITVVVVVVSLGLLGTVVQTRPSPSTFLSLQGAYYFTGQEFGFELYAFEQIYGHPTSGATVNLTIFSVNSSYGGPGVALANLSATTGIPGLVSMTAKLNGTEYMVSVSVSKPGWNSPFQGSQLFTITRPVPGVVVPFPSSFASTIASGQGFQSANLLQLFYLGPNATGPPNYQVYWAVPNSSVFPYPAPLPETSMHRLGTLSSAPQTFSLVVPRGNSSSSNPGFGFGGVLQIELFTSGGALVATDFNQSASAFYPPPGGTAGADLAFSFSSIVMAWLVALMAVLASYSVYGKDRVTGVLEGVLARPVSRLGLTTSRFLAVVAALTVSVTAALGVLNAVIAYVFGGFLPLDASLAIFGALLVEVGMFTAIAFVLAHALRSGAGVVASGLGLWALLTVGWLFLIPIFAVGTGAFQSNSFGHLYVGLQFLNPTQLMVLAQDLYTGTVQGTFLFGQTGAPAAYGVTIGSVIADGLAWVAAPAALLVFLVRYRD